MAPAAKKRKAEQNGGSPADVAAEADTPKLLPADARRLLEPLSKDQLLDILQDATCRHVDVLNVVRALTDVDASIRKIIVRRLDFDTTSDGLRAAFSAYGDIREAVVIVDKSTRKSKGYGFVTFCHVDSALLAAKESCKIIDGRVTVTQLSGSAVPQSYVSQRKIFVSGVPEDMPSERLLQHFSQYGEIEEGPIGYDKTTMKSKGYALFVYKTPEEAEAAIAVKVKMIDGHTLNCSYAKGGGLPLSGSGASTVAGYGAIPGSSDRLGGLSSFGDVGAVKKIDGHNLNCSLAKGGGLPVTSSGASTVAGYGAIPGSSDRLGGLSSFGDVGAVKKIDGHNLNCNLAKGGGLPATSSVASTVAGYGAISGSSDRLGRLSSFGDVGAGRHYSLSSNLPSSLGVRSSGLMDARFDLPPSPGRGASFGGGYSSSSQFDGIGRGGGLGAGGYDGLGYSGGAHYQLGSSGITSGGDYGYSSSALRGQHQQPPRSPPDYRIPPRGSTYQQAMPPYY